MTITAVSTTASTPPTQSSNGSVAQQDFSEDFSQFLTLLTAQVENQDPLEPLDSTAFVEQLATFSALEQQVQTNDHLADILSLMNRAGGQIETSV